MTNKINKYIFNFNTVQELLNHEDLTIPHVKIIISNSNIRIDKDKQHELRKHLNNDPDKKLFLNSVHNDKINIFGNGRVQICKIKTISEGIVELKEFMDKINLFDDTLNLSLDNLYDIKVYYFSRY